MMAAVNTKKDVITAVRRNVRRFIEMKKFVNKYNEWEVTRLIYSTLREPRTTGMISKRGVHWRLLHQSANQHHYRGCLSACRAMHFSLVRNSSASESSVFSKNGTNAN